MHVVICMYELCVSVFVCRCARVSVCEKEREREQECSRAHARTYTYTLLLFVSLFLFSLFLFILSVTSFASISLCMHRIWYNTKHTRTHTHTHTGSRIHLRAVFSRHTSSSNATMCASGAYVDEQREELVHTRVKRLGATVSVMHNICRTSRSQGY
jgi:hypothetical protein